MTWVGAVTWWGEVIVVLVLCYIAYRAIFHRAGVQEPGLNDLKKLF